MKRQAPPQMYADIYRVDKGIRHGAGAVDTVSNVLVVVILPVASVI